MTTTPDHTMRAVLQHRYGTSEVLRVGRTTRPRPGAHEVLVEVRAAGLDRGTEHLHHRQAIRHATRDGPARPKNPFPAATLPASSPRREPRSPGSRSATRSSASPRAPSPSTPWPRSRQLAPKPANLSFAQAAVVPVSAGTALQALIDVGRLRARPVRAGHRRLRRSRHLRRPARQGVRRRGHRRVQHRQGDLVTALGADHVIDYASHDFADGSRRYDLILDIAGNPSLRRLRRALNPRGTVVFVGGEDAGALLGMGRQVRGVLLSTLRRQRFALLATKERGADYERLGEPHRGRTTHAVHRPHLPTAGRAPRRPATRRRPGPRQGRRRPHLTTSRPFDRRTGAGSKDREDIDSPTIQR